MRKILLSLLISASFIAISCEKEDSKLPCEQNNFGALCIDNMYSETVTFSINGTEIGTIAAGSSRCQNLAPGNYAVYARETDAILFPDEWEFTVTVNRCEDTKATLTP